MIIILMGVSGSGKTTVSQSLASATNWEFYDADFFHSSGAKSKMSSGKPLTDEDRAPWLQEMQAAIDQWLNDDKNIILACSALKPNYRQILRCDDSRVKLVYLKGSYALLHERLMRRQNHFMKAELLQSQLDTLEEPNEDEAIVIDISKDIPTIVQEIRTSLSL
jgi:gluconokinase